MLYPKYIDFLNPESTKDFLVYSKVSSDSFHRFHTDLVRRFNGTKSFDLF